METAVRARLAAGDGVLKAARAAGCGTSVAQRDQGRDGVATPLIAAKLFPPEERSSWNCEVVPIQTVFRVDGSRASTGRSEDYSAASGARSASIMAKFRGIHDAPPASAAT